MIEQFLAFGTFAFVASVTPGPNNVLLTATGAQVGILRGFPALLGIAFGFALMVFLLSLGLGAALLSNDTILAVLRWMGIAMLLYLAWQIATAPVANGDATNTVKTDRRPVGFVGAALFQWVNPKAWLVTASAITAYMSPDRAALEQALTFGTIFILAGFAGCLPWLMFGSVIGNFLKTPRTARAFNLTMAALLVSTIALVIR